MHTLFSLLGCMLLAVISSINGPSAGVPSAGVPSSVAVLSVGVPLFAVPSAAVPSVAVPSVAVLSAGVPSVGVPSFGGPSVGVPLFDVPSVAVPRALWPVDAPHIVLRPFIASLTRYSAGHRGIDLAAAEGEPVYAIAAGTVTFAGVVVDRPLVSIAHGGGFVSSLEPITPTVAPGDTVAAGQEIGTVARSAHCDLACVHLGVRLDGDYVSPLLVLGTVPRAVLLPIGSG